MAIPRTHETGLLFCGFIHTPFFDLEPLINRLSSIWGSVIAISPEWIFSKFSDYYDKEMGPDLRRRFYIFDKRIIPFELIDIKLSAIKMEEELSLNRKRVVNIDPGFISKDKLLLASAKNHYHRIYLNKGIFLELTMAYYHKDWHALDWTYPDFKTAYKDWFLSIRQKFLMD